MRRSFKRSILLCALVCLVALVPNLQAASDGSQKNSTSPESSKGSPVISVPESTYDFGEINEGGEVSHDFLIRNTGNATLDINQVRPG